MRTMNKQAEKLPSPSWKRWHKAFQKLKTVRHNININPSPHGPKWKINMLTHWDKQIKEFAKQEPVKFESR